MSYLDEFKQKFKDLAQVYKDLLAEIATKQIKKANNWEDLLDIAALRDKYLLISGNCHTQGLKPNDTELVELAEAIKIFEEWEKKLQ